MILLQPGKEPARFISLDKSTSLQGQFHGFELVQVLALAVVNFTVSY